MISLLSGNIVEISGAQITIDVNGVGYEVHCTRNCLAQLEVNAQTRIVIHTDVKEDSIRLYGFEDQLEKQVFLLLTRVNGVGTRTASDIISRIDKLELLRIIGSANLGALQSVKGIGKKTAERIVLELKDRVAEFASEKQSLSMQIEKVEPYQEAIEALQALGFPRKDAERAVRQVPDTAKMDSSQIVKDALRYV